MTRPVPSSHVAVLANPAAGKGRGARAAVAATEQLRSMGAEVRTYSGTSAAETRGLAEEALQAGPAVLVVVGGDGTLSGVLEQVRAHRVPVALVPAGTGNDLARVLGLPRDDAAAAAAVALAGVQRTIDIGEVSSGMRTTAFLTVAALGFDAKVSDRTNRLRWPRGRARYYLALLVELARLRPTDFRISCDGEPEVGAAGTLIAVGNTESYGGGLRVCAGAVADDGMLDVVQVAPLGRLRLVLLFPLLLRGTHLRRREVMHRSAREVRVTAPDLVVYADGERIAERECTITVVPGALRVMVPGEAS